MLRKIILAGGLMPVAFICYGQSNLSGGRISEENNEAKGIYRVWSDAAPIIRKNRSGKDFKKFMNAIITVVGNDKVGIIAKVSAFLAERNINIEDISQTVLSGNFVMMMSVNLGLCSKALEEVKQELVSLGDTLNVSISLMHEKVFSAMHRV